MSRLVVLAAMLAVVGSGCSFFLGGESGSATVTASVATVPRSPAEASGAPPVEIFNGRLESVDEPWERTPGGVAREYADEVATEARRSSVVVESNPDGGDTATATVTLDGLLDDSVRSLRFDLVLERSGETWRLRSSEVTQRCAQGRGHQDFSPAPCL